LSSRAGGNPEFKKLFLIWASPELLKELANAYGADFGLEKRDLRQENTFYWDVSVGKSIGWPGPARRVGAGSKYQGNFLDRSSSVIHI
jgi:hypothetical protein